jgi:hypothetical protein
LLQADAIAVSARIAPAGCIFLSILMSFLAGDGLEAHPAFSRRLTDLKVREESFPMKNET